MLRFLCTLLIALLCINFSTATKPVTPRYDPLLRPFNYESVYEQQLFLARIIRLIHTSDKYKTKIVENIKKDGKFFLEALISEDESLDYIFNHVLKLDRHSNYGMLLVGFRSFLRLSFLSEFKVISAENLGEWLSKTPDELIYSFVSIFVALFEDFTSNSRMSSYDLKLTDLKEIWSDPSIPEIVLDGLIAFIKHYFDAIGFIVKKNFVAAVLETKPLASKNEILGNILMEVGPGLGKMFQLFADKTSDPEMQLILQRFKSSIKPMSLSELNMQLNDIFFPDRFTKYFERFEFESTTSGTIGEGHFGVIKVNGKKKDVFCKMKRFNIEKIVEEEMKVAKHMMADPTMRQICTGMIDSWRTELDWKQEMENSIRAAKIYSIETEFVSIRTSKILSAFPKHNPQLLVMEVVKGNPLSKYLDELETLSLEKVKIIASFLENLLSTWYDEIANGSGYFHGDLHAGNILFSFEGDKPVGTLIDFGNFGHFPSHLFRNYYSIIFSMLLGDFDKVCHLLGKNEKNQHFLFWEQFEIDMKKRLSLDELKKAASMNEIMKICAELLGDHPMLPLDKAMINFSRAKLLIESIFESFNAKNPFPSQCPLADPLKIYAKKTSIMRVFENASVYLKKGNFNHKAIERIKALWK